MHISIIHAGFVRSGEQKPEVTFPWPPMRNYLTPGIIWIWWSRQPGRDIAFYPNKIGQKLTKNRRRLKKNISGQVPLPQHDFWCPHRWRRPSECTFIDRWKCGEMWRNERLLCKIVMRVGHASVSVAVWNLTSLAHIFWAFSNEISLVDTLLLDLTDLIGWLFSDVTGEETLLGFSGQPKLDKNNFFSELYWTPYISANFCPIFIG